MNPGESTPQTYLPDFCKNRIVFVVVLIAEILAIVLALATTNDIQDFWFELGLLSLFIQWVAVGTVATLCAFRRWLVLLSAFAATVIVYVLAQIVMLSFYFVGIWTIGIMDFENTSFALISNYNLFRNLAISSIVSLVALRYFYVQHQWKQNLEAEARARFQALQARIRPHFLFNSMNTIASLTRDHPDQAEEAILDLADLFRSTLEQPDKITLRDELESARRYLRIEALRLGDRLQVDWQVDDSAPLDLRIPSLILQPLLENAVYYGIQPLTAGGCIRIRIQARHRAVVFTIANPLPSPNPRDHREGHRMAQDNVRQRLALAYGEQSRMEIQTTEQNYSVSIIIPMESGA